MDIIETDLRAIVRLLGETAALPGGLMDKKLYLLDGLCDIAGSIEWAWTLSATNSSADSFCVRRKIGGNFHWPLELPQQPGTVKENEHVPGFPPSHTIFSALRVNADTESQILLRRNPEAPSYTRREIHLASLVLDEVPWLHWRNWQPQPPALVRLSPRLQSTRDLLLLGHGRKEIADQIGISEGTVNGYIRRIYQYFGVNSQAELMKIRPKNPATY